MALPIADLEGIPPLLGLRMENRVVQIRSDYSRRRRGHLRPPRETWRRLQRLVRPNHAPATRKA